MSVSNNECDMISNELQKSDELNIFNKKPLKITFPHYLFVHQKERHLENVFRNMINLRTHKEGNLYNSIFSPMTANLDNIGKIRLDKGYDALQSLEISCVNPSTDIESVSLLAKISLPKNYSYEQKLKYTKDILSGNKIEFPPEFYRLDTEFVEFYFPIKTVDELYSNWITFSDDINIPLILRYSIAEYYIQVKFTNNHIIPVNETPIKLNYLIFDNNLLKQLKNENVDNLL